MSHRLSTMASEDSPWERKGKHVSTGSSLLLAGFALRGLVTLLPGGTCVDPGRVWAWSVSCRVATGEPHREWSGAWCYEPRHQRVSPESLEGGLSS